MIIYAVLPFYRLFICTTLPFFLHFSCLFFSRFPCILISYAVTGAEKTKKGEVFVGTQGDGGEPYRRNGIVYRRAD